MNKYNKIEAIKAQEKYCKEKKLPFFAPNNGVCYKCGKNIFEEVIHSNKNYSTGITVEGAGNHLITGCPHCNYSYCE